MVVKLRLVDSDLWKNKLSKEWDYDRNNLDPSDYGLKSHRKVWWKCYRCKTSFETAVRNRITTKYCLRCPRNTTPKLVDTEAWKTRLHKEWDYEKNTVNPEDIHSGSGKQIYWKCSICNYEFESSLKTKVSKLSRCMACNKKAAIPGKTDLKTVRPKLLDYWDYDKNDLTPDKITLGSNTKIWWKCSEGHSFEKSPRAYSNSFYCEVCSTGGSDKQLVRGKNDFKTLYPELIEFYADKNSYPPEDTLVKSHRVYWWQCELNHIFKRRLVDFIESQVCYYCSGRLLLSGFNDFDTLHKALLEEWDYEKNSLDPKQIKPGNNKKVWWKCKKCGEGWLAQVRSRAQMGTGCPRCASFSVKSAKTEKLILEELEKLFPNEKILHATRSVIRPYELDFYFPERKLAIEYNGDYWHSDVHIRQCRGMSAVEYHSLKRKLCEEQGVRLAFLWESDWKFDSNIRESVKIFVTSGILPPILDKLQRP